MCREQVLSEILICSSCCSYILHNKDKYIGGCYINQFNWICASLHTYYLTKVSKSLCEQTQWPSEFKIYCCILLYTLNDVKKELYFNLLLALTGYPRLNNYFRTVFSLFLRVPVMFSQITWAEAVRIAAEKGWNEEKTTTNTRAASQMTLPNV